MKYEERRARVFRNIRIYLVGILMFVVVNIVVIMLIPGYSFPQNFFAIWPILGWGVPTLWRVLELRRYKISEGDADVRELH